MELRCYPQIFYFSKKPFPFPVLCVLVFVLENVLLLSPLSMPSDRPLISDEQGLLGGLLYMGLRGSGRVEA